MKLEDVVRVLKCEVISGGDKLNTEVRVGCGADLMSDVLAFIKPGSLLLTGLASAHSVRTADIAEAKAICYVRGKKPNLQAISLAEERGIPLLSTRLLMYEACGKLYKNGLVGGSEIHWRPKLIKDQVANHSFKQSFEIDATDFSRAGAVSTQVKTLLKEIGVEPAIIRRIAIATFEAEMNVVMYADTGRLDFRVSPERIEIEVTDKGQGIENIDLAMQEGYSTATDEMREMGFGAGMGLPNIKRNCDRFQIESTIGVGTRLNLSIEL